MKVHELIDKPEKWLKNHYDSHYEADPLTHKPAGDTRHKKPISFCIVGGIDFVTKYNSEEYYRLEAKLAEHIGKGTWTNIVAWNNSPSLTFEEFHRVLVGADV